MNSAAPWLAMLIGVCGLLACASLEVRTDFDAEVDFRRYQKFAWLEPPLQEPVGDLHEAVDEDVVQNSLLDKRVRVAVDRGLASRGLVRAEAEAAELLVRYRVRIDEFLQQSGSSVGVGGGSIYRHHPIYVSSSYYDTWWTTRRIREGVLTLDLIDASSKRIVWRGWTVGRNPDGYFSEEDVRESVRELLVLFPPIPRSTPVTN